MAECGMKAPEPERRVPLRPVWVGVLLAVVVIAVCVIVAELLLQRSDAVSNMSSTAVVSTSIPATTIYPHPINDPVRVVMPAIKADALIIKIGILEDGSMDVPPFGLAGWYRLGPAPGASGPSVIVGHLDTKTGPDVFYRLRDLKPGDEILVYDKSGDVAKFVVDSSELVLKSELPTTRIWNSTNEPVIRLITCGGKFDRSTGHYLSNTIVYGHLVE
jgi:Sortase domain